MKKSKFLSGILACTTILTMITSTMASDDMKVEICRESGEIRLVNMPSSAVGLELELQLESGSFEDVSFTPTDSNAEFSFYFNKDEQTLTIYLVSDSNLDYVLGQIITQGDVVYSTSTIKTADFLLNENFYSDVIVELVGDVPDVEDESPEIEDESPEIEDESPEVEGESPEIEDESPEVEDESPEIEDESPEIEDESPQVEDESPQVEDESPQVEDESPQVEDESPQVEDESPEVEDESPEVEDESPEIEDESPEVEDESPEIEDESPEVEDESPEIEDESPEIEDESPEVEDESPEVEDESPEVEDESPEVEDESLEEDESPEVEDEDDNDSGSSGGSSSSGSSSSSSGGSSSSSSGGSSSSSSTSYTISKKITDGGNVFVNRDSAKKDTKVSIVAIPDEGFCVSSVKVARSNGTSVTLEKSLFGDHYYFIQPNARVTISVEFEKTDEEYDGDLAIYSDVLEDDWFYEFITYSRENALMLGENGEFKPLESADRGTIARALAVLGEGLGITEEEKDLSKLDDIVGHEFEKALQWTIQTGVMVGYSSTEFGTNDFVTREQFATTLFGMAKQLGTSTKLNDESLSDFGDSDLISGWAEESLGWCVQNGLMVGAGGESNHLNPQGNITRAEVATMLFQFSEIAL